MATHSRRGGTGRAEHSGRGAAGDLVPHGEHCAAPGQQPGGFLTSTPAKVNSASSESPGTGQVPSAGSWLRH